MERGERTLQNIWNNGSDVHASPVLGVYALHVDSKGFGPERDII